MYSPNETTDTSLGKVTPGDAYCLGVVWHVDPVEETIRLYRYARHVPCSLGSEEGSATQPEMFLCYPFVWPPQVDDDESDNVD